MSTRDLTHNFLKVEGRSIAYLEAGEGPPFVLLYGVPTSSPLWRDVTSVLARGHRIIAPDMLTLPHVSDRRPTAPARGRP